MKDKLLTATGPKLSKILGEVLQQFKETHVGLWGTYDTHKFRCKFCNKDIFFAAENDNPKCTRVNPIALTPDNALKWPKWCIEEYGNAAWKEALGQVHRYIYLPDKKQRLMSDRQFYDYIEWLEIAITPEEKLKACGVCALENKK